MRQRLSPADTRRAWLWAALIVLMMLAAGVLMLLPRWMNDAALLPGAITLPAADDALLEAARDMDGISVDARLDPAGMTLTFTQTMTLHNRTGQDQSAAVLRSWTGAYLTEAASPAASEELYDACYGAAFEPGGLTLQSIRVNGSPSIWHWLDTAQTVLSVPADWPADSDVTLTLACSVDIPHCASRFGYADGVFMLGNVFPVPAVWEDGSWRTDPYISVGDPFLSECANWHVTLTVPDGYTVAASAAGLASAPGMYEFTGYALRDFALVISDRFFTVRGMAGDVLVSASARTKTDAQAMLQSARQAIASFEQRWGDYAWPAFTLAETPFPFGGMEYPGMAMIASDALALGGEALEYAVAHETAHQWWACMVGSDGWHQPWQDESLCEYAVADYFGDRHGAAAREDYLFRQIEASLRITIPRGVTPGSPIDRFSGLTEYSMVVYQRGAALWTALETHLGKEALDALLRDYQARYRFRIASRGDLCTLISQHCGMDMGPLLTDYLDTYMQ